METEISAPIEYKPHVEENEVEHEAPPTYYYPPPQMFVPPSNTEDRPNAKGDFLSSLDKNAYIIIFAAFILGFFMGKTMQQVILRHG